MSTPSSSHSQLRDFVETHELTNRHSIINFNSIVTIATAQSELSSQEMEIMITFDGFANSGTVSLMENELDPNEFPTRFLAEHQTIEHVDKVSLKITGKHPNPRIGNYEVKIIPLGKLRD